MKGTGMGARGLMQGTWVTGVSARGMVRGLPLASRERREGKRLQCVAVCCSVLQEREM